jgi:predicted kinase
MKSLQLDKPHVIVTIGIPGSGKSFFSRKFADTFNAPYLDQSTFDRLATSNAASKELQSTMLEEMLKTGRTIVMELAQSNRSERAELSRVLRKAGYVPLYIWVQVDTETAMNRAYRMTGASIDDYQNLLRRFAAPHPSEKPLVISGKHTFATQAKAVLRKLSSPRQTRSEAPDRSQPSQAPSRGQIIIR